MSDQGFSRLWNELPLEFKLDVLHWHRLGEQKLRETIMRHGRTFYPPNIPRPSQPPR